MTPSEKPHTPPLYKRRRFFLDAFPAGYAGRAGFFHEWGLLLFNLLVASVLLLLAAPLMLAIAVVILFRSGRPVLYKGQRMGLGKRLFVMYKFRTLPPGAQQLIGPELLSTRHGMVTPFTKFLRDTRLDELPQLLNIIKGDINFVGPRPVRPEIYETFGVHIINYERRFQVKPGLLGYSQLCTPHSSPKRIRALVDNRFIARKRSLFRDLLLILFTIHIVLRQVCLRGGLFLFRKLILEKCLRRYAEKRAQERIRLPDTHVQVIYEDQAPALPATGGPLVDLNESYLKMRSSHPLPQGRFAFKLKRPVRKRDRKKIKTCRCMGEHIRYVFKKDAPHPHEYVVRFIPTSPFNQYMLDQYFLSKSMA